MVETYIGELGMDLLKKFNWLLPSLSRGILEGAICMSVFNVPELKLGIGGKDES